MIGIQQRFLHDELERVQDELERIEMGCCADTAEDTRKLTAEYQQRHTIVTDLLDALGNGDITPHLHTLTDAADDITRDYLIGLEMRLQRTITESTVEYALKDVERL